MENNTIELNAVLSNNSLAFKLWKSNAHASPGQIINQENYEQKLLSILTKRDINPNECSFNIALTHSEFILKPLSTSEDDLVQAFKSKNVIWSDKNIRIREYEKLSIKCAFSVPIAIEDWLEEHFYDYTITHLIPIILHGISEGETSGNNVFCAVTDQSISVVAMVEEKIKYANSFEIHHPEDMLYYLRLATEQANQDPGGTDICLIGRIQENSRLINLIKPYFDSISFVGKGKEEFIFKDLSWLRECA